MDVKVSRKERRWQPDGQIDVLVSNVCDLFPVFGDDPAYDSIFSVGGLYANKDRQNIIMDIEMLDNEQTERIDRATFAVMKQRGGNPVEPDDGNQWAEAVVGEVFSPVLMQQVISSVHEEGPGVRVDAQIVDNNGKSNLAFKVILANAE